MKSGGIHDGHRKRMKEIFLKQGFTTSTPPHQILEMLLFFSVPRKDTNDIAHRLIERFGSLSRVFEASAEELTEVEGVTENSACLIKMILPVSRRYFEDKTEIDKSHMTHSGCIDLLKKRYFGITEEMVYMIFLDNKGVLIGIEKLAEGNNSYVSLSIKTVLQTVMKYGATAVILSHNHPMGYAFPSDSDCMLTKKLCGLLKDIDVRLIDHIIFAGDDCVSMALSDKYKNLFSRII